MILNSTKQTVIATQVKWANDPFSRMKGLLGQASLPQGQALVISSCNSIHMFFMRFPLDVIFVDKHNSVVGVCVNIQPFNLSPIFWNSSCAIELPAGTIHATQTAVGDRLKLG